MNATARKRAPSFDFAPESKHCEECGAELRTLKTHKRRVTTLAHGSFDAREVIKRCPGGCGASVRAQALRELVPPGQRYGYDLVVWVGLARYRAGRQRDEIRHVLYSDHGIQLSAGTVSALSDRFLAHFEGLHVARIPGLRAAQTGGYPLHIDATCERGRGGLFACVDGWRGWVLEAARIATENSDTIAPIVERVVQRFGPPIAIVRDMGEAMAAAVAPLRNAGVPDLVCHYHFAAALGKQLFGSQYDHLRGIVRQAQCRSDLHSVQRDLRTYSPCSQTDGPYGTGSVRNSFAALLFWLLKGQGRSDPPFPFALPHFEFVRRCLMVSQKADLWVCRPRTEPERRALSHVSRIVERLQRDPRLTKAIRELDERWAAFIEVRSVLRLTKAELPRGDTRYVQKQIPELEVARLKQIESAVEQYLSELTTRLPTNGDGARKPTSASAIVLQYFKRHGHHLFGHPALLDEEGRIQAVVERTNNVEEHLFGRAKQLLRRRVGRAHLARDLEQQPPQVALVDNLRSPEYVRILCGSLDNLAASFAQLDMNADVPLRPKHPNACLQNIVRQLLTDPSACDSATPTPRTRVVASDQAPDSLEPATKPQQRPNDRRPATRPSPPSPKAPRNSKPRDPRLPPEGSIIERWYKGRAHYVRIGKEDFTWRNTQYNSLSPIAQQITKSKRDGVNFFGLNVDWNERAPSIRGRRINRTTMLDLPRATEF